MREGRLAPITHPGISTTIAPATSVIAPRRGSHKNSSTIINCGDDLIVGGAPRPDYARSLSRINAPCRNTRKG
jgi:hypothetical protein